MSNRISDNDDQPDLTKNFSRWSAPYWAMMHGIAAKLDPADWAVLCALYCHLPNVNPGKGRIEALSGVSPSSVKRARRKLKAAGLIDYDGGLTGGSARDERTLYHVTDIRSQAVAAAIIARLTGATMNPVHDEPGTGVIMTSHPGQSEPGTGATMNPKVHKPRAQRRAQGKCDSGLTAGAAASRPFPAPAAPAPGSPSALCLEVKPEGTSAGKPAEWWLRPYTPSAPSPDDDGDWSDDAEWFDGALPGACGEPGSEWDGFAEGYGQGLVTAPIAQRADTSSTESQEQATEPAAKVARTQRSASQKARTSTAVGLTEDEKATACASLAAMRRYLLYGAEGLRQAGDDLPAANTNWLRHQETRKNDAGEDFVYLAPEKWNTNAFAGYFWFKVCEYRAAHGQKLSLPSWGRVNTHIKAIVDTRPAFDVVRYLTVLTEWFSVIRFMSGGAGRTLTLDEGSLCHKLVDMAVDTLMSSSEEARRTLWAQARDAACGEETDDE